MSAPEDTLTTLLNQAETGVRNVKALLASQQPPSYSDWELLHDLQGQTAELPLDTSPELKGAMVRLACALAATALIHANQGRVQKALQALQHLEGRLVGAEPLVKIQLFTYQALVAHFMGNQRLADASSRLAVTYLQRWHCTPEVRASILLVRGEVAAKDDQRKLLRDTLKFMKSLKNFPARTNEALLLEYRVRVKLCNAHCTTGRHLLLWWQGLQTRRLEEELRYGRSLTLASLEQAVRCSVVEPLLHFD